MEWGVGWEVCLVLTTLYAGVRYSYKTMKTEVRESPPGLQPSVWNEKEQFRPRPKCRLGGRTSMKKAGDLAPPGWGGPRDTWTWQIEGGQAAKAKSPQANLNVSCITDESNIRPT